MEVLQLLGKLPPYEDAWINIHDNQTVPDIINEVLEAHQEFALYYDKISSFFYSPDLDKVCNNIYSFLKKNIKYKEETESDQTTALPTGILTRRQGDCKHYSGFSAGILDSLKRMGHDINWCYRFASYRMFDKTPHHVFVVVNPGKDEIWIDPTPGANSLTPIWQMDKKINMPIRRNLAGFDDIEFEIMPSIIGSGNPGSVDIAFGARGTNGINGGNPYFTGPFLTLNYFTEEAGGTNTDWQKVAQRLNNEIAKGPSPGHTVSPALAEWIYDTNNRGWNFFYPNGAPVGWSPAKLLPVGYPVPVWSPDGQKLILDPAGVKVEDGNMAIMHDEAMALTAWVQSLINEFDATPYRLTPRNLSLFSRNKSQNSLLIEHRGKNIFQQIGHALGDALEAVKDATLKIVGSIPRNAFLALVGLNVFNMAKHMKGKIDSGMWDEMAHKWKNLGGNPDKLKNTIEDGAKKKAILGTHGQAIGGPEVAAWLAAAAPIIAAMLKFLDAKVPEIHDALQATKGLLQEKFPDFDWAKFDFLDANSTDKLKFVVDDKDNENLGGGDNKLPPVNYSGLDSKRLLLSAAAAGLIYFSQKDKKKIILPLAVGAGVYFINPKF